MKDFVIKVNKTNIDKVLKKLQKEGYEWICSGDKPTKFKPSYVYTYDEIYIVVHRNFKTIAWDTHKADKYDEITVDEFLNKCSVKIFQKGNKVIAVDETCGKSAVARCNVKDTFDFETGAKIALSRLLHKSVKRHAKIGEYILITSSDGHCHNVGEIRKVEKIVQHPGWVKVSPIEGIGHVIRNDQYEVLVDYKKEESNIHVGDTVECINCDKTYTQYSTWNGLKDFKSHFVSGKCAEKYVKYKVLKVEKHPINDDETIVLIQNPNTTQVFMVEDTGLKKC